MAENLSQSELDYPFKLLEYFNGFRVSKVTFLTYFRSALSTELSPSCRNLLYVSLAGSLLDPFWTPNGAFVWKKMKSNNFHTNSHLRKLKKNKQTWQLLCASVDK